MHDLGVVVVVVLVVVAVVVDMQVKAFVKALALVATRCMTYTAQEYKFPKCISFRPRTYLGRIKPCHFDFFLRLVSNLLKPTRQQLLRIDFFVYQVERGGWIIHAEQKHLHQFFGDDVNLSPLRTS